MGSQRMYLEQGGFSSYLYTQVGQTITASNGVEGKVVRKIGGTGFDGLPTYSNTSEVYFKTDADGEIIQARVYKDRKPFADFDWNHAHTNGDGQVFPEGVAHVQMLKKNEMGRWVRESKQARYMTDEEISRYQELFKKANPNIRFRP